MIVTKDKEPTLINNKTIVVTRNFSSFEEVIADEGFLAWYLGSGSAPATNWQEWLSQNPQYLPLVEESILHLKALHIKDKPVSSQQTEDAHKRLMASLPAAAPVIKMGSKNRNRWWLSAAAAIILIIGGAILSKGSDNELKLNTAYGQVSEYKLPDGSEVMLNANSNLSMKKTWDVTGDREVWIEGEAFFHVKKTTTKNRFIVHAGELDIIVTGTQFNVVSRKGENNVLLKEGSITLKMPDGKLVKMVPGEYVRIDNKLPRIEVAPEEKVLAWTQAKLVFENTPMTEAAKIISIHYGVKVVLDKSIEEKKISGILPNDNLEVLLKALEATLDFQITRKGKEIVISIPK